MLNHFNNINAGPWFPLPSFLMQVLNIYGFVAEYTSRDINDNTESKVEPSGHLLRVETERLNPSNRRCQGVDLSQHFISCNTNYTLSKIHVNVLETNVVETYEMCRN